MKRLQNLLCAGLCLAMAAEMAACSNKEPAPSSSTVVSSAPSSAVSSVPEPESSHFTPAEDLIPPDSSSEGVPDPFQDEFSQNPIDKKYDEDYSLASSFSMMRQACDTAAKNWKNMVDVAYEAALEAVSEEEQISLRQEQDDWLIEVDDQVRSLRDEAGDSSEGILDAARKIVLLYRDRARELCRMKYDADGALPDFSAAMEDGEAVG